MIRNALAIIAVLLLLASPASAHPEGGLLVDRHGNIYFTYVHPMTMPIAENHNACLWKLEADGTLIPVLTSDHNSSSFDIALGPDGLIYVAERQYQGEQNGKDVFESSLRRIEASGKLTVIIPATPSLEEFNWERTFLVGLDSTVFFCHNNRIRKRTADGKVTDFYQADDDSKLHLGPIAWGPDESIYVVAGYSIRAISKSGTPSTLVIGLNEALAKLPDFTLGGSGQVGDIDVDSAGNVYATSLGARRVVKFSPSKQGAEKIKVIRQARTPWAPHAVFFHDGNVFSVESALDPSPMIRPRICQIDPHGEVTVLYEEPQNPFKTSDADDVTVLEDTQQNPEEPETT